MARVKRSVNARKKRRTVLGRAKGCEEALSKLDAKLVQAGAVPDFHIMKDHLGGGTEEPVPYPQTYDFLRAADVLVDLYNDPRAGFSLRLALLKLLTLMCI